MRSRMALEDGEIAENMVLICQSVATSRTLSIRYG